MSRLFTCRAILIALLAAALLSGCGRRGGLEPPGSQTDPDPILSPAPFLDDESPGAQDPEPQVDPAAPQRRFVLDPLI